MMKYTPSCMNEVVWADRAHGVITNGHTEMNVQTVRHISTRSQDDAMVRYVFQRPESDPDFQNYSKHSRWALGDDSVLEVRVNENSELETDFQALALETGHPLEFSSSAKKLWGLEDAKQEESKGIFLADQWRDTAWSTGQNVSEHAVSQPIMVQRRSGSYPGSDTNSLLSPRSSDTGGLGVKMVEYVLGSSPTAKELDVRMSRLHVGLNSGEPPDKLKKLKSLSFDSDLIKGKDSDANVIQANGVMHNGLNESNSYHHVSNSRQSSPCDDIVKKHMMNDKLGKHTGEPLMVLPTPGGVLPANSLDAGFEHVGIDSLAFDYSNSFMHSVDSPNALDFNSQLYQRNQGQSLPMLGQQQFALQQAGQVQSANPAPSSAPFHSSPFVVNQDAYTAAHLGTIMPGPAMMPQYYSVPPWGMFPTPEIMQNTQGQGPNSQQQHQQQLLRGGGGGRPITPQGPPTDLSQGSTGSTNSSNLAQNVQGHGGIGNGGFRLMGSQGQQNSSSSLFSSNTPTNSTLYASPHNSSLTFSHPNSALNFSSTNGNHLNYTSGLGVGGTQTQGYGTLGSVGTSLNGIGNGNMNSIDSPRRDTYDRRESSLGMVAGNNFSTGLDGQLCQQIAQSKGGQFYGPFGSLTSGPGPVGMLPSSQSLTPPPPPPSVNGSLGNLNLGAVGGRILSTAPGADTKYILRNGPLNSNVFGSSSTLFPHRTLQRSSSLEKSTGRSRLLEDFRNNRYPNLQLRDLTNHMVEFSQDQHGSRFIQQKLERASSTEKQLVFSEILEAAYSLMTDVFGNYVIQKFFEFGTPEQKQSLATKVKGHVLPLALQMYGCRVIQKALESIPPDHQKEIVKELDGHVLKCVKDQNGNHVVQKCIECVDPMALQFIINAFQGQVFSLSTHPYGCRVIQRILEHCTPEQTTSILDELHQHTEQLVQDQYGNYVVQHVLEHGCQDEKSKIVAVVRGKVLQLAQHKFASNVVEKCVTHSSRAERAMLIEEVCTFNDGALYTMMKDQYANYVVQKMIEVAEPPQRKLLLHKIRPHVASLRKYTYGKHIIAKLEKHLLKNNDLGLMGGQPNGTI